MKTRYMATGESFRSLAFSFRISQSYISRIIRLVLKSLSERLTPILLPPPTKENLKEIAMDFWIKWNFPNCVGAIDGKHIRIFAPGKSGSLFFNYKDFFSIVLLAIVDANCKFIFVDVGAYGKEGDEAFRLEPHMMRMYEVRDDYEKTVFNYRLSRARRTSENSFGLLSQVFRVFYTPISLKTETVDYLPPPSRNMISLSRSGGYTNFEGFNVRDEFKQFFNSPQGAVEWQNHQVRQTDIN
ncbi:uncharacterized protein LOC103307759 [Acyrthosiphon pisum]|uniref:DDE Tnp4 domain-containing protein n=1 Tax=Acyrthosiphon pisum TaxID=7029 RepID=A0A8R1WY05_ACYPI|nr:uncharacterized protein LOC103307759 [Acyrthosiphon pisum]|eukprot:XP_008178252.1 PREDICTED: uncharacterized protein LOC103307759 [Acyrthosiphon pisum]